MNEEMIEHSEDNYNRPDLVFCPMCEEKHENTTYCQTPDIE